MNATNLDEKLAAFSEHWQPRTIGQFNGHDLMVVKVKGEFVWHKHDDTDDFFHVLKGRLTNPLERPRRHTWARAKSSSCRRASSIVLVRTRKLTCC